MGNGNIDFNHSPESSVRALKWENGILKLIDQRKLPFKEVYISCKTAACVAKAIKDMVVRGAPAIGVSAAYGAALAALNFKGKDKEKFDIEVNRRIGLNGTDIFKKTDKKIKILTHCNAGALATSGHGTALSVIRNLNKEGKLANVIVDETRPFLQGARLTAWELYRDRIPFFIISDNMAGYFMSKGEVAAVLVGADRIASNGDTANKIGTLSLSILAGCYGIPFYVAAPLSTVDIKIESGDNIPIEYRDGREMREISGKTIIPEYMPVENPAFDITPAGNITAIITERGIIYPPYKKNILKKTFS